MRHPPSDLVIRPRDRRFGRGGTPARWWLGHDPVATAFFNALSATFPKGEAFFVESVRRFRADAPPRLSAEIAAFVRQEVAHTREHVAFNGQARAAGYDLSALERRVDERLAVIRARPAIASLAVTMALEHFTAILAHHLLADPRLLADADPQVAALWRWHAVEEIEHKGVAYDTWLHATRGWSRWQRWRVRSLVMLLVSRNFMVDRSAGIRDLLRQDGLSGPRMWVRVAWFAFGRPGLIRRILPAWAAWFRPGFHPWLKDDRHLIAAETASDPVRQAA